LDKNILLTTISNIPLLIYRQVKFVYHPQLVHLTTNATLPRLSTNTVCASPLSTTRCGHFAIAIEVMASTVGKRVWNIALFGAPGGGKGTISNKMLKEFSFFNHVSLTVLILCCKLN